jgi:hypothetical protein
MCRISAVNKKGPSSLSREVGDELPGAEENLSIRGRLVRVERMLEEMIENGRPEALERFRCQLDSVTNLSRLSLHLETQTTIMHLASTFSFPCRSHLHPYLFSTDPVNIDLFPTYPATHIQQPFQSPPAFNYPVSIDSFRQTQSCYVYITFGVVVEDKERTAISEMSFMLTFDLYD